MELVTQRVNITKTRFVNQREVEEAVESLLKSPSVKYRSENDIEFVRKFYVTEKAVTEGMGDRQIKHYISTSTVDRDGEVLVPKGAKLKHYNKNKIVLWSHDYREPQNIVGKNLWLKPDEKGILSLTQMASHEKADMIYGLYKDGFLNAWSAGFIPIRGTKPGKDEEDKLLAKLGIVIVGERPKPGEIRYIHESYELLEYSAVAVPANPDALTEAVAKGYGLSETLLKELEINIEKIVDLRRTGKTTIDLGSIGKEEHEEKEEERKEEETDEGGEEKEEGIIYDELGEETKLEIYEKATPIDIDYVMKPYPNEHSCKIKDLGGFEKDSFRSMDAKHNGKPYRIIIGRLKGKTTTTTQAYRYPKDSWTEAEARAHCKDHDGILFEPAVKEYGEDIQEFKEMVSELRQEIVEMSELRQEIVEMKEGRVLSAKNISMINSAIEAMGKASEALEMLLESAKREEPKGVEVEIEKIKPCCGEEVGLELVEMKEEKKDGEEITKKEVERILNSLDLEKLIDEQLQKAKGKVG